MSYKKTTVLEGMRATGDYESFCFGKLGPSEHMKYMEEHHPLPTESDELQAALAEAEWNPDDLPEDLLDEWRSLEEAYEARALVEAGMRVYPSSVLPEEHGGRKGRWRVTVEFWPEPSLVQSATGS